MTDKQIQLAAEKGAANFLREFPGKYRGCNLRREFDQTMILHKNARVNDIAYRHFHAAVKAAGAVVK